MSKHSKAQLATIKAAQKARWAKIRAAGDGPRYALPPATIGDEPLALHLKAISDLAEEGDYAQALKVNDAIRTRLELLTMAAAARAATNSQPSTPNP